MSQISSPCRRSGRPYCLIQSSCDFQVLCRRRVPDVNRVGVTDVGLAVIELDQDLAIGTHPRHVPAVIDEHTNEDALQQVRRAECPSWTPLPEVVDAFPGARRQHVIERGTLP